MFTFVVSSHQGDVKQSLGDEHSDHVGHKSPSFITGVGRGGGGYPPSADALTGVDVRHVFFL